MNLPLALKQALFDSLAGSSALTCLNTPDCCQLVIVGLQVKFRINRRNVAPQSLHVCTLRLTPTGSHSERSDTLLHTFDCISKPAEPHLSQLLVQT